MRLRPVLVPVLVAGFLAACSGGDRSRSGRDAPAPTVATTTTTTTTAPPATAVTVAPAPTATATAPTATAPRAPTTTAPTATTGPAAVEVVEVAYRLERRTVDDATAGFEAVVGATLTDPRGWARAGYRFVRDVDGPYLVVLAEGPEVDALCLPYDTYGRYSCQNGPTVALNADRWRAATPAWTGDLGTYRQMLVNHEVGHLLGMRHPRPQCPRSGRPAPIMNQQSTELDGCLPNPWPLEDEVAVAARHDRKLAPGPGE